MMRSNALRSTTRSRMIGNARARHGSTTITSPSWNLRMCNWQVAVPSDGPCARPLIIIEHEPQIPSRQSWSNAIGSRPSAISCSLTTSNISRNDISALMSCASISSNEPGASGPAWRQTRSLTSMVTERPFRLLVTALREVDVLELERLLVERRCVADAGELPRRDVREVGVVAQRLALLGLVLDA